MTTEPQGRFIRGLLIEGEYPYRIGASHQHLPHFDAGYSSIEEWLDALDTRQASQLIDALKIELNKS